MSEGPGSRLDRLAEAVDHYLEHRDGASNEVGQILSQREDLREYLEPMLSDTKPRATVEEVLDFSPGRVLGDYRIVSEIGRGGMGVVFEAEQVSLGRRVAVKVLRPHLTLGARQIERFRNEAGHAARLHHRSIVPIYEVGESNGVHFFAMELIEGRRLDTYATQESQHQRSRDHRITLVTELTAQVAEALHDAHQQGVVHRDVKPHNIIVDAGGRVRLLDFGLAKLLGDPSHSQSGVFVGTPHYVSPEQALGASRAIGPASDVFSLGVVLYELIAGARPFAGATTEDVLHAVRFDEPRRLRSFVRGLPRDLETICTKALEKDPQRRFATAAAFAADLRRFQRNETIEARPVGALGRLARLARRRPAELTASALLALVVIGGPVWYAANVRATRDAIAAERDEVRASDEIGFRAMAQLIETLGNRVSGNPEVDDDDKTQLEQAVALCHANLVRKVVAHDRMMAAGGALRQIAEIYEAVGEFDRAIEVATAADSALARRRATDAALAPGDAISLLALRARYERQILSIRQILGAELEVTEPIFAECTRRWEAVRDACAGLERERARAEIAATYEVRGLHLAEKLEGASRGRELLEAAAAIFEQLPEPIGNLPQFALAKTHTHVSLGRVRFARGDIDGAAASYEASLAVPSIVRALPRSGTAIANAELGLSSVEIAKGEHVAAESRIRAVIDATVARLERLPGRIADVRVLVAARAQLGGLVMRRRDIANATRILHRADADAQVLVGRSSAQRDLLLHSQILGNLASCLMLKGEDPPRDARATFLRVLELQERLAAVPDADANMFSSLGGTRSNLAAWENEHGDPVRARDFARAAIEAQQRAVDAQPNNSHFRRHLGIHWAQLAYSLPSCADFERTIDAARSAAQYAGASSSVLRMSVEAVARAIARSENELGLAPDELRERTGPWAADAIGWLETLVDRDAPRIGAILRRPRLDALSGHPAFEALLERTR